jgi:hypothetical protein
MFGTKKEEVTKINVSVIESGRMRWAGHVTHGEMRNSCNIFVLKPQGNRACG